ncbi:hypothetical protein F4780DRAFT_214292 [Xylariomycetidae sp. FL0641]|nr:hypothetical protein F4780DRAFT_214292 [Xylariomycetidae sp. FL0641]
MCCTRRTYPHGVGLLTFPKSPSGSSSSSFSLPLPLLFPFPFPFPLPLSLALPLSLLPVTLSSSSSSSSLMGTHFMRNSRSPSPQGSLYWLRGTQVTSWSPSGTWVMASATTSPLASTYCQRARGGPLPSPRASRFASHAVHSWFGFCFCELMSKSGHCGVFGASVNPHGSYRRK